MAEGFLRLTPATLSGTVQHHKCFRLKKKTTYSRDVAQIKSCCSAGRKGVTGVYGMPPFSRTADSFPRLKKKKKVAGDLDDSPFRGNGRCM